MDKKILIIGSDESGQIAAIISKLKSQHPYMEAVTIEDIIKQGLCQTIEIKAPLLLLETYLKPPPPTRAERRKQERQNKKKQLKSKFQQRIK